MADFKISPMCHSQDNHLAQGSTESRAAQRGIPDMLDEMLNSRYEIEDEADDAIDQMLNSRHDIEDEADDAMSSSSSEKAAEDSDEEDVFKVTVMGSAEYPADYKASFLFRWQCAISDMASHLRRDVLLPLQPGARGDDATYGDVHTGVALPSWHCAFKGCSACATTSPSASASASTFEKSLWTHLGSQHGVVLSNILKKFKLVETFLDKAQLQLTLYNAALLEQERQSVPKLGHSTDRRTFQHVSEVFREEKVALLMCKYCESCESESLESYEYGSVRVL